MNIKRKPTFQHLCIECIKEGKQVKADGYYYCEQHKSLITDFERKRIKKESKLYYEKLSELEQLWNPQQSADFVKEGVTLKTMYAGTVKQQKEILIMEQKV